MSEKKTVSLNGLQYPDSKNPYTRLWRESLGLQGVEFSVASRPQDFLLRALSPASLDLVHLHWVHPVSRNFLLGLLKFLMFQVALLFFRLRGVKIYWAVHNLLPHERQHLWLDRLNNWLVARFVTGVFVHGQSAIPLVSQTLALPESRIHCAMHGNYAGVMPSVAVTEVDVEPMPGRHFLYFGLVRPYKGVLDLLGQYAAIPLPGSLTIAGDPQGAAMRQAVEAAAAGDSRIVLHLGYLEDEDLAHLIHSADVVVLPFHEVFTSGSLVMALTMGKPVILPRVGLLSEYVDEDCAFFYQPGDVDGLAAALQRAAACDRAVLHRMGLAAAQRAQALDWFRIAEGIARVYRSG